MNIEEEIKTALRQKETVKLGVLRDLKNVITSAAIRKGNIDIVLEETEILGIIRKLVKQREDSIEQFINGNRPELAEKERAEKLVLEAYLPKPLTDDEILYHVNLAITDVGATSKKDMGRAIKRATELCQGRVDGKTLSTLIASRLS